MFSIFKQKNKIIKITTKEELRDIILSGKFDDSIQVKNNKHICKDGSIYDYSSITDIAYIFKETDIKTTPLFDTSNIVNMDGMFYRCTSLKTIPLFDTSNVKSMNSMFFYCSDLEEISYLDVSNVRNIEFLFGFCNSLKKIPMLNIHYRARKSNIFYNQNTLNNDIKIKIIHKNNYIIQKRLKNMTEEEKKDILKRYN